MEINIYQKWEGWNPINLLILPPKPQARIWISIFIMLNDLRCWVIICFVTFSGIGDLHCIYFIFIIRNTGDISVIYV
jgi:hypothetical protein